ncbi:P-loop containing nucleoside triphosphate hydrolase protein [Hypoxylon sp. FL1857]|nr:P-loop containing nucleoside triphosphate hydrolase protein [Hypoxylon sp. FL1857]
MCRIRPENSGELMGYSVDNGQLHDHPTKLAVIEEKERPWRETNSRESNTYEFERVFTPKETNNHVFKEISEFVQSVVDGKKACIFCYGQSGTGKTYTMSNLEDVNIRGEGIDYESDGIIPRVKTMIFREKSRLEGLGYEMSIGGCCYEIYNNELRLLEAEGQERKAISTDARAIEEHDGFKALNSISDFDALINMGTKNRHFRSTQLNDTSSRSHFIVSLQTKVRPPDNPDVMREGLLNLVDLAGSERTQQAGTTGIEFKEGININSSLSSLGKVFKALVDGRNPPYNDNILTKFLRHSLGRDCMTLMFLMISLLKSNWPTTKHTLQFARDVQSAKKADSLSRNTKAATKNSLSNKLSRVPQSLRSRR